MNRTAMVRGAAVSRMRDVRVARGLSQRAVARLADLSEADVSKIELGRLRPYSGQAARIAHALGVQVSELWPGE